MKYELTKEELEKFARDIYDEACCGYMDLKETVCEGLLEHFLADKKAIYSNNLLQNTNLIVGSRSSDADAEITPNIWDISLGLSSLSAIYEVPESMVRQQEFVRPESYLGNESERL